MNLKTEVPSRNRRWPVKEPSLLCRKRQAQTLHLQLVISKSEKFSTERKIFQLRKFKPDKFGQNWMYSQIQSNMSLSVIVILS